MNDVTRRALRSSLFGILALIALLFIPAGTLDYWQAWLFMAVFVCTSGASTIYLAIRDPMLLERRMHVGPRAEKEPAQKIIMVFAMVGFITMLVFPVLDHRFRWSSVPASVSLLGDAVIALGFLFIFFVFRENSYGASTIQIAEGQTVISTGVTSENSIRLDSQHEPESSHHPRRCLRSCTCSGSSLSTFSSRDAGWKPRTCFFIISSTSHCGERRLGCGCTAVIGRCWYG
jgi:hypothetical protein